MSVSLKIPKKTSVPRRFKLTEELSLLFDDYVRAAGEENPGVEPDEVLEAILSHHMAKDRAFQRWLKGRVKGGGSGQKTIPPSLEEGGMKGAEPGAGGENQGE